MTQQTCAPLLATQNHGFVPQEGGGTLPPPPATQDHGFVSQEGGAHALPLEQKLDLDTCLTPEAQTWTYLNYRL